MPINTFFIDQVINPNLIGKPKHVEPRLILSEEWAAIFIHWLVKSRGYGIGRKKKHSEILPDEIDRELRRFCNLWERKVGCKAAPKLQEILDYCLNKRWLMPCSTNTFQINPDEVELR